MERPQISQYCKVQELKAAENKTIEEEKCVFNMNTSHRIRNLVSD